ncbi:unnamed protein product [Tetraodon nigroviridis]|uniref:Chromosome undetermined SCAF3755, whole genome shotgun sequence n=1 Tax=Tetraodon nigroviridis TaxID=99883 RepID=Q4TGE1_TETNG|nr:unnamed protein product [Tetraodon nigroviridis]
MGIEIPPPKGGPAVFTASSPGIRSTGELSPGEDSFRTPESREDLNDGGSVSLSEHEEVQFLENELENQKQKYQELASFTKSLLTALRSNDLERQQELMASLPQPSDQDWDVIEGRGAVGDVSPDRKEVPLVQRNKDVKPSAVTEPSASEEQLREEQK